MILNFVDILAAGYIAYGVWRGRRRGFAQELPGAISWTAALLTGAGIYKWTDRALTSASSLTGQTTGGLGFLGVMIGAYFLSRHLRGRIRAWADKRCPEERMRRRAGSVAGGIRTFVIAALIILSLSALPVGPLRAPFATGSLLGRSLNKLAPPPSSR